MIPTSPTAKGPFQALGTFPFIGPLYMDEPGRLLYQIRPFALEIRDLDSLALLRSVVLPDDDLTLASTIGGASSHISHLLAAADSTHHRLFHPRRNETRGLEMEIVDGRRGTLATYDVIPPDSSVPITAPFSIEGLTYYAPKDVLYIVYILPGTAAALGPNLTGTPGRVFVQEVAASDGSAHWSYEVPGCGGVLPSPGWMSPVSRVGRHIYAGCFTGSGFAFPAGLGMVAKIALGPDGVPKDTKQFAAPGPAISGIIDPVSERSFFNVSGLTAVFDGRNEVWVGFAPARSNVGLDPEIGRFYACGSDKLVVSDAAVATPVPLGSEYLDIVCRANDPYLIQVDSSTRRLFVPVERQGRGVLWQVLRDGTDPYERPDDFNPDEGAENVDEAPGLTETNFGAQAQAYGTRVVLVGGPMGVLDNTVPLIASIVRGEFAAQTGLAIQESSREVRFAHVRTAKLGGDGGEAAAISVDRDDRFETDFATSRSVLHGKPPHQDDIDENFTAGGFPPPPPGERLGEGRRELEAGIDEVATGAGLPPYTTQPHWPFETSGCQAFGGPRDVRHDERQERFGASSQTDCGLDPLRVSASADAGDALSGQGIRVGESTASVTLERDPALGVVAHAVSVSRNINIGDKVLIAEARADAKAWARGRPGKANTSYTPEFRGVRIRDASGTEVYSCTTDCAPEDVVDAMNTVLGPRIHALVPRTDAQYLHGTPRGTTASVQEDFWQRVQDQVLFDKPVIEGQEDLTLPVFELRLDASGLSKSGVIVQFAGVTATAIYRIFKVPQFRELTPAPRVLRTLITPPPPAEVAPEQPEATVVSETITEKIRRGVRWAFGWGRSPGSVLAAWALLLSPFYVAARRRAYLRGTSRRRVSGT